MTFPKLKLRGSHSDIGELAGRTLSEKIHQLVTLYTRLIAESFGVPPDSTSFQRIIRARAERYQSVIREKTPHLADEIEAMARGAQVPAWQLYFVNARTEILCEGWFGSEEERPGECTLFATPASRLLACTWDWHPELSKLLTILDIEPNNKPRSIFMAEPGIIGKNGLNSESVGVILAILFGTLQGEIGLPVHVLLRLILECETSPEAADMVASCHRNTFSRLLLLDSTGNYRHLQLFGGTIAERSELVGTNHLLGQVDPNEKPTSVDRFNRASTLQPEIATVEDAQRAVLDTGGAIQKICRLDDGQFRFPVITVASLVLDLRSRVMHIARAPAAGGANWVAHRFD